MALSDHAIISNLGGFGLTNLTSILDIEDNEPQIIQHSSYYDIDSFKKLISNHNNIYVCHGVCKQIAQMWLQLV